MEASLFVIMMLAVAVGWVSGSHIFGSFSDVSQGARAETAYQLDSSSDGFDLVEGISSSGDLALHLVGDDVVGNAGDPVSSWPDSSSQSRTATQSTTNLQPTLNENVVGLNGHSSVEFGASAVKAMTLPASNSIFSTGTGLTMYAVLMSSVSVSAGLSFVVDYGLYNTLGVGFAWDATQINHLYTPTSSSPAGRQSDAIAHGVASGSFALATISIEFAPSDGLVSFTGQGSDVCLNPGQSGGPEAFISGWGVPFTRSLSQCQAVCRGDPNCFYVSHSTTAPNNFCLLFNANAYPCTQKQGDLPAFTTYRDDSKLDSYTNVGSEICVNPAHSGGAEAYISGWGVSGSTLAECQGRCYADPNCVYVSHSTTAPEDYCLLFNANAYPCTARQTWPPAFTTYQVDSILIDSTYTDLGADVCLNPGQSGGPEAYISGWGVSGTTLAACQAACRANPNCVYVSHSTTAPFDFCLLFNANAYPCTQKQGDLPAFNTYLDDSKLGSFTDFGSDVCLNPGQSGGPEAYISGWGVSGTTLAACQALCSGDPNCVYASHSTTAPFDFCILFNANAYPCTQKQGDLPAFTTYLDDSTGLAVSAASGSYTDLGADVCLNPGQSGGPEAYISGWGVSGTTLAACQALCSGDPNCVYASHSTTAPFDFCILFNANAYPCTQKQGDLPAFTTYRDDTKLGSYTDLGADVCLNPGQSGGPEAYISGWGVPSGSVLSCQMACRVDPNCVYASHSSTGPNPFCVLFNSNAYPCTARQGDSWGTDHYTTYLDDSKAGFQTVRVNGAEVQSDHILLTQLGDDEIAQPSSGTTSTSTEGLFTVGAQAATGNQNSRYFQGQLAELRVYTTSHTTAERDAIESAMSTTYGLSELDVTQCAASNFETIGCERLRQTCLFDAVDGVSVLGVAECGGGNPCDYNSCTSSSMTSADETACVGCLIGFCAANPSSTGCEGADLNTCIATNYQDTGCNRFRLACEDVFGASIGTSVSSCGSGGWPCTFSQCLSSTPSSSDNTACLTCLTDYCTANTGISSCPSSSRKQNGGAREGGPEQIQSGLDLYMPATSAAKTPDLMVLPTVSEPEQNPLPAISTVKVSDLDSPAASSVSIHPSTEPLSFSEDQQAIQLKEQTTQLKEQTTQLKEQTTQLKEQTTQLKQQTTQLKQQELDGLKHQAVVRVTYAWIGVGAVGTIFGAAMVVVSAMRKKQEPHNEQPHHERIVRRRPSLAV